ncbi:MAG: isoprenylcysteine carboxylmethyltransferase family protein [Terriglobales bacterium]
MNRGEIGRVWAPLIVGGLALTAIFYRGPGPHGAARWIGLGLAAVGLGGVITARYTLGKSFSVAAKARELVTRGIYSRIRNPIYIFGGIFLTGVALILWHPFLIVLLAIMIPVQIMRARKEARVLEEKFGDEYREYRSRTWF